MALMCNQSMVSFVNTARETRQVCQDNQISPTHPRLQTTLLQEILKYEQKIAYLVNEMETVLAL